MRGQCSHGTERPRILLVDDNRLFLRVLSATCRDLFPSAQTDGVATGAAALAYCQSLAMTFDVVRFVVLDFHLPDMDAPRVLECLRRSPHARIMPVLVLTQAYWVQDDMAARDAGATTFLPKPSGLAEMRRMLAEFSATARAVSASETPSPIGSAP